MLVFKLSWLPYILILAGILLAVEGQPEALILTAIGALWLYIKFKNKQAGNAPGPSSASSGAPASAADVPPAADHIVSDSASPAGSEQSAVRFCRQCGAKADPNNKFCSKCGKEL